MPKSDAFRSTAEQPPEASSLLTERTPPSHRALLLAIAGSLAAKDPTGDMLARADDVEQLAEETATRVLNASASWVEHLGAFYDGDAVRSLLARDGAPVSRQAVHKRRGLLALTTGSGQVVYPAAQFRDRSPAPRLAAVLDMLPEELVSRWTVASWLLSPEPELDNERPVDVLHDGGPEAATAVLAVARRWAVSLGAAA